MRRALVVLVLLLAACSGSDSTEGAAPVRSTTTTSTPRSAGCDSAVAVSPGETKVTMRSGGVERWFLQQVPGAPSGPLPLVVDIHGYSEGAEIHSKLSALGPYGDEHGFITLTPQGTGDPVRWDTGLDSPDVHFVEDLLDEAERTLCVDTSRVYVTGLSNGAFMTSTLACVLADRVAAVAPVAGIRDPKGCEPSRPVPVLAIHGTADTFVAYDGGLGESALDLPAPGGGTLRDVPKGAVEVDGPSIPDITAAWAKRDGCGADDRTVEVTADVDRITWPCPKGVQVDLYRVEGGGHSWPGSPLADVIQGVVGKTTTTVSANALIWNFFQSYRLPPKG
jgi:polyhydroxybutyrate depolymerase